VTKDLGLKWTELFTQLEVNFGLDVANMHHIWLLHHLYLAQLNEELAKWMKVWNVHKLSLQGRRCKSPQQLYFQGMLENGTRGLDYVVDQNQDVLEDPESYAVDWEHLGNAQEDQEPDHAPEVVVEGGTCPCTQQAVEELDDYLNSNGLLPSTHSNQQMCRWVEALAYMEQIERN
jgi:hypothetical protein